MLYKYQQMLHQMAALKKLFQGSKQEWGEWKEKQSMQL